MPFSSEQTQLIKDRIKEKLRSQSLSAWQSSFLTNMDQMFARYGEKTQLSTAQYRKLHEILKIERANSQGPEQSETSRPSSKAASKSHTQRSPTIKPLRIVYTPRRVLRRIERRLHGPVLIIFALAALVGTFFYSEPTSRSSGASVEAVAHVNYVTGNSLNQRSGPGTNYAVMGQLLKGAQVKVLGRQGGWSKVSSSLGQGWVSSNYISPKQSISAARSSGAQSTYAYSKFQTLRTKDVRIIDGDTIGVPGLSANLRLVGFNTPETYRAKCVAERDLGDKATARLRQLVSGAESVQVRRVACACKAGTEGTQRCNFGRFCGTLLVDGRDVGKILIGERLAVPFHCGKTSCPRPPGSWCQ